jgi:hypothetical protein
MLVSGHAGMAEKNGSITNIRRNKYGETNRIYISDMGQV